MFPAHQATPQSSEKVSSRPKLRDSLKNRFASGTFRRKSRYSAQLDSANPSPRQNTMLRELLPDHFLARPEPGDRPFQSVHLHAIDGKLAGWYWEKTNSLRALAHPSRRLSAQALGQVSRALQSADLRSNRNSHRGL